jgi:hypothetical protein
MVYALRGTKIRFLPNKPKKTNKINMQLNYLEGFKTEPKDAAPEKQCPFTGGSFWFGTRLERF